MFGEQNNLWGSHALMAASCGLSPALTAEICARSWAISCGICGRRSSSGTDFSAIISVLSIQFHLTITPHS